MSKIHSGKTSRRKTEGVPYLLLIPNRTGGGADVKKVTSHRARVTVEETCFEGRNEKSIHLTTSLLQNDV